MDIFNYAEEMPLALKINSTYDNMAFDGCYYYFLTHCNRKIIKTDKCFRQVRVYESCREYNCFCFDYIEDCFWAASKECPYEIFKLDKYFREIGFMKICEINNMSGIITGISLDCCNNTLLLSFANTICELNKRTGQLNVRYRICTGVITMVLSIAPGYMFAVKDGCRWEIYVINNNDMIIDTYCIPKCYIVKNMIFNPCIKKCDNLYIDFLITKNGYCPCVIRVDIECALIGVSPYPCNYQVCEENCGDDCHDDKESCTDIIESIALVETALSHILNAEGEKLQKVLATTDDIEKILCVNREVNRTIINATHLEHTLYDKLSMALECCGEDEPCNPCVPDHNPCNPCTTKDTQCKKKKTISKGKSKPLKTKGQKLKK
ncbi:MAG: hypothetical protein RSC95_05725 [Anaerovoracaceae bacterium]